MLISIILWETGQECIVGQMLNSDANCNLAFVTASATTTLMKQTLEFTAMMVIKSLLTIHFTLHTLHHVLQGTRHKILKPTKIRQVVSFTAATCLLIKAKSSLLGSLEVIRPIALNHPTSWPANHTEVSTFLPYRWRVCLIN